MPQIPLGVNLGQNPIAIPSIMFRAPKEGAKSVGYSIPWQLPLARNLDTVSVNMQDSATLEFSQISGLIIDNSQCGSDIDFIFPDTDVIISIPAYAPYTALQVNTQQVQFFVRALGALAGDVTTFTVLNYAPSPVAVPITVQQQQAIVSSIAIDGLTITQLVAAGINGTLRSFALNVAWNTAALAFNNLIQLRDGTGRILWAGNIAGPTGAQLFSAMLANLGNISLRFQNGLQIVQIGGFAVGGTLDANVYYVTP